MNIKPIETIYKGYRFRSRLEARWAVFFDALGIEYEYEPEGYEFDDGTRYLPDFKIRSYPIFVEIKPIEPDKEYRKRLENFSIKVEHAVLLIWGSPGDQVMELFCFDEATSTGGVLWNELPVDYVDQRRTYFASEIGRYRIDNFINKDMFETRRFYHALSKARQARFEFGETP